MSQREVQPRTKETREVCDEASTEMNFSTFSGAYQLPSGCATSERRIFIRLFANKRRVNRNERGDQSVEHLRSSLSAARRPDRPAHTLDHPYI